jgi:hypothetical protein
MGWWITVLLLPAPAGAIAAPAAPADVRPAATPIQFTDVTRPSGLDFVHSFGDARFSNLVEAVGSGVAWIDYDQDGHVDLYLASGRRHPEVSDGEKAPGDPRNRLFRNRGDGTFEDVTGRAGVGCDGCFAMGLAVADYDNDGLPDIYVANFGPNVLYRNFGNGTFRDLTRRAGVGHPGCSVAATWFDFDRDGHLDLYVGNYVAFDPRYRTYYAPDGFPGPLAYRAQPDVFYRNRGDGTFEDATARVGLPGPGRAMGVTAADFDGDGFDDVYVTNDASENFLLRNVAGRRFENVALAQGVAFNGLGDQVASMAVDAGDYDGDGRLDLFVSDNALSSLFHNQGGDFAEVTAEAGIARSSAQYVGWGAFFLDFDNDGDLDLYKANSDLSRLFGQEDQLFENLGGRFRDIGVRAGPYFQEERMGRGAAFADYDNDGDPDIVINNLASPAVLLRNDNDSANHALVLRLVGRAGNRDGIGAKVTVTAAGRRQVAQKRSAGGYLSQNDPRLFFGLGPATRAERVEIVWPSGRRQVLDDVAAGRTITVEEPAR